MASEIVLQNNDKNDIIPFISTISMVAVPVPVAAAVTRSIAICNSNSASVTCFLWSVYLYICNKCIVTELEVKSRKVK